MAISSYNEQNLNRRLGQVPFQSQLGSIIRALQVGAVGGGTDPLTGAPVPEQVGYDPNAVEPFSNGTASAEITTAGTAVTTAPVTWPQSPKRWSITGPVGATVESITYENGQVTFQVNANATGTVTVYFS